MRIEIECGVEEMHNLFGELGPLVVGDLDGNLFGKNFTLSINDNRNVETKVTFVEWNTETKGSWAYIGTKSFKVVLESITYVKTKEQIKAEQSVKDAQQALESAKAVLESLNK